MAYICELHAQSPVFCGVTQESPIVGKSRNENFMYEKTHGKPDFICKLYNFQMTNFPCAESNVREV